MIRYGIPYKGSKNKIASELLAQLPMGKRLIDLFGGGFAISHCALVEYRWKWETVVYNDINPLLAPLIKDAIAGKYSYDRFDPQFITYKDFNERKETDGYVKWIWSFGSDGNWYMFAHSDEEKRTQIHDYIVYGKQPPFDVPPLHNHDIGRRRVEWQSKVGGQCGSFNESKNCNDWSDCNNYRRSSRPSSCNSQTWTIESISIKTAMLSIVMFRMKRRYISTRITEAGSTKRRSKSG